MIDQLLAQRAVLEALEAKITALGGADRHVGDTTLELYFWDDLAEKHQKLFRSATLEDIASAITIVEKESAGRFKLVSIKPSTATRDVLRVGIMQESGRPILDVSNLYWEVRYTEKLPAGEAPSGSQIFWLTPRELHSLISNERRSFAFRSGGVQFRLLQWFSEHKDLTKSKELAEELKTTTRTIATEIGKLKRKADEAFGLDEDNFVQSSYGEGYGPGIGIKIKLERGTS